MRLSPFPSTLLLLTLAVALPASGRQAPAAQAKPAAPAEAKPAPAQPAPKATAKKAPKPAPKTADADRAALKPEVAAQANVRSQMLKQRKKIEPKHQGPKTDLNGASKEALMKLPDVTAALADKIIAGRPYLTKAHLITHDVIPYAVYDKIKDRIVAVQAKTPAPPKK
jgi:DNA uptake protein ComE-like DNA-binding protein